MLTFGAEILIIGAALAVLGALCVTVTLPPSCKGLEAAAFTGKLYPERKERDGLVMRQPLPGVEPFPSSR